MPKVLVVDHSEGARVLLKTALEKSGHSVSAIDSPDLAESSFKNTKHDLVLLDMHLPGNNGLICFAMICADPAIHTTPVSFQAFRFAILTDGVSDDSRR